MENSDSNWNHQIKAYKFLMEFYTFRHGDYDDCVPSKCSTRWFDDDVLQNHFCACDTKICGFEFISISESTIFEHVP
ncbi:unnamed protein product [Lathyrus sativus]|nr:unnamed protein product [Lathyrus sativus]